jgi:hypothetical protein
MHKVYNYIILQIKYFFINHFWRTLVVLAIIIVSIILNGIIWYKYLSFYKMIVSSTPVIFSSSVLILNIFLADIIFPKRELAAYILLLSSLVIQIFILYYFKIAYFSGAF